MYYQSAEGSYFIWNDTAHKRNFEHHLDANPPRAARVYALMSVARKDAEFPTPNHPTYPDGHGCNSAAGAQVLAQ